MLLAVTPQKLSRPVIRQHMLSWCHTYIRHHMLSWCQTYSKASYSVLHRSTSDALPPSSTGLSYTCPPRARCLLVPTPSPSSLGLDTLSNFPVYEICTAGCRSFLWRGTGVPLYNDDGLCRCSCDGDSWSHINTLGHPSCVPVGAHMTFGLAGLFFSVIGTFHATFHLHRQVSSQNRKSCLYYSEAWAMKTSLHMHSLSGA